MQLSSVRRGRRARNGYIASKHAVEGPTKAAAPEVAESGTQVASSKSIPCFR
jgi:NAD(P)-dependent dehydrogenase (short-subunit alcohol dehydrogenase family)